MTKPGKQDPRAGFTLVEAMVTLVTFGLLTALALPKIEETFAATSLRSAHGVVAAELRLARTVANQGGRTALVRMSGSRIWVEARPRLNPAAGSVADTVGQVKDLRRDHSVSVTAIVDSVVYTPQGLAASGGRVILRRSSRVDTLNINALGMVDR